MLDNLLNSVASFVNGVGDAVGAVDAAWDQVRGVEHSGDPTIEGSLARGRRPQASDVRDARLEVPGDIDHERARRDAERTLASIDFSRPEISLWVPATGSHSIPTSWKRAVQGDPVRAQRTSLALVDYPADANFNDSVSTGMETLRLVLAGIAERGGQHRVTLAGHSQGAWVIGDAINTPELGRMVDRAVLYGHPAPAKVDWSRAGDPNVRQVDDPQDPFTFPLDGGRQALDAIDQIHDGQGADGAPLEFGDYMGSIGTIAKTALANPRLATYLISKHVAPEQSGYEGAADPHHYETRYADGARFLAG